MQEKPSVRSVGYCLQFQASTRVSGNVSPRIRMLLLFQALSLPLPPEATWWRGSSAPRKLVVGETSRRNSQHRGHWCAICPFSLVTAGSVLGAVSWAWGLTVWSVRVHTRTQTSPVRMWPSREARALWGLVESVLGEEALHVCLPGGWTSVPRPRLLFKVTRLAEMGGIRGDGFLCSRVAWSPGRSAVRSGVSCCRMRAERGFRPLLPCSCLWRAGRGSGRCGSCPAQVALSLVQCGAVRCSVQCAVCASTGSAPKALLTVPGRPAFGRI